ncbi:hypothetical protein GGI03_005322 [Coemansia sp. RSA 2337]|nr:hypothetical protein H4S03_006893 [Coemansia sp. S3946]KAJ2044116.1 hypothetical protein H4S04_006396 [Coemansia sp. S16]KAJ2053417.1 hypothetical protein GGI08_004815 [Coemansia sp. S2]KAJ2105403.1 hypothetical protein IW146_008240 [Coemansia sp. RSA 922]KAJ2350680.1 hypothetical protein GGH92_002238 [Coemansia sp. RSA 2673]KAJ2460306.1 hypothetical protein GGI03_005322 [Coemansia sp. RSA 2337]
MFCKRATLTALAAVVATVGCVSAAPQGIDLEAILNQANGALPNLESLFNGALPNIGSLINDPAFLASVSKQMDAFNDFIAKNPDFLSTYLNGGNIPGFPTDFLQGLPTNFLDNLVPKPTNTKDTSKPSPTKPAGDNKSKSDDDKPEDKSDDDKSDDHKHESGSGSSKPNAAAGLKPVAGLFAAGVVAVAALF